MQGGDHGEALRESFGDHQPEAIKQSGKQQHIVLSHLLEDLRMGQGGDPAVVLDCIQQGSALAGCGSADQGEAHLGPQCGYCVEGIGEALALAKGAHIEHLEGALRPGLLGGRERLWRRRAKRHHIDLFSTEACCDQGGTHIGTGHDHPIGERQLLIFALQLGGSIQQPGERYSPLWLKLALRREDLTASPPVADRQVVEAVDSQALGLLKGMQGCILVEVDTAEGLELGQATRQLAIEAAVHPIHTQRAVLMALEHGQMGCAEPGQLPPGMAVLALQGNIREGPPGQLRGLGG